MQGDGIRQRLEFFFVKVLPGLIPIRLHFVDGQKLVGALLCRFLAEIPQQRAKTLA